MEILKKSWYKDNMTKLGVELYSLFDVMTCYVEEFGNCFMPDSLVCRMLDGELVALGFYLLKLKRAYARKLLHHDSVKFLQNLVDLKLLSWDFDKREEHWCIMYFEVIHQVSAYGRKDYNVPYDFYFYCLNQRYCLGEWLNEQRVKYAKGTLRYDRRLLFEYLVSKGLLNLNVDGKRQRKEEEKWSAMFQHLLQFEAECGHCNVPTEFILVATDNTVIELRKWLDTQRQMHSLRKLKPDWERRLQEKVTKNKLLWDMNEK